MSGLEFQYEPTGGDGILITRAGFKNAVTLTLANARRRLENLRHVGDRRHEAECLEAAIDLEVESINPREEVR